LTLLLVLSFSAKALAGEAAQPQGEFHKYIVKKTDEERRKTKSKEWWGKGVVVFSKTDIPRLGKTKEVEPTVQTSFKSGDAFYARIYLPKNVGTVPALIYRVYVDGKHARDVESKGDTRPEAAWSSWVLDLPDHLKGAFDSMSEGKHDVRLEIWSSDEQKRLTIYTDKDSGKVVGAEKDSVNFGKFLAAGDFTYEK
jgi:hypothetical protein